MGTLHESQTLLCPPIVFGVTAQNVICPYFQQVEDPLELEAVKTYLGDPTLKRCMPEVLPQTMGW